MGEGIYGEVNFIFFKINSTFIIEERIGDSFKVFFINIHIFAVNRQTFASHLIEIKSGKVILVWIVNMLILVGAVRVYFCTICFQTESNAITIASSILINKKDVVINQAVFHSTTKWIFCVVSWQKFFHTNIVWKFVFNAWNQRGFSIGFFVLKRQRNCSHAKQPKREKC